MAIYFFSDAHLGENGNNNENNKLEKLSLFFERIKGDCEKLIIIGDLFDFWFEYRQAIPKKNLQVIFRLVDFVVSGIEVHYVAGNHDFWLGDFLENEAGIKISRDSLELKEQGKRIFITHGDGIAPSDKGYRFLKKILRNRLNIWLYQKLPVDWGLPLARYVSARSRDHTSQRPDSFLKEYDDFALTKIKEGFDTVIMGHLHIPVIKKLDNGLYINSGDFVKNFSYVRLANGNFSLDYV